MQTYEFDWTEFTERTLKTVNYKHCIEEDELIGFVPVTVGNDTYIVDIHYYNYGSKDRGFDLEVYKSNKELYHLSWLGNIKDIKSATNYNRFCRRAENLIISLIS